MSQDEETDGPSQQEQPKESKDEIQEIINATYSRKLGHVIIPNSQQGQIIKSKGFGIQDKDSFYLTDYEVLYLIYTHKLRLEKNRKSVSFEEYVELSSKRDPDAWARFLIFRDLRTRGYVVREGFGFPIDFRVYDRGDYSVKAAKYIVFGLNEGKTLSVSELKKHIDEMTTMGKEAVVAVVERRGEVIYYKIGKWRPNRSV